VSPDFDRRRRTEEGDGGDEREASTHPDRPVERSPIGFEERSRRARGAGGSDRGQAFDLDYGHRSEPDRTVGGYESG
jgi:hypothetical protein